MRAKPLYLVVRDVLLKRIAAGEWRPGDRLPTDDALVRSFGVSRITVRQALELLQQEGLVERFAGKGSFVTSRPPGIGWTASSIDDVLELGAETLPQNLEWRAVRNPAAAQRLGVSSEEKLYRLRAVRARRGVPIYSIEAFVPAAIGARLRRDDLASRMLITVLEEKLGILAVTCLEEIGAGVATAPLARRLGLAKGMPLLILELTYFAADSKAIEYVRASYRADMFRRRNLLSRGRAPAASSLAIERAAAIPANSPFFEGFDTKPAGTRL